MIIYYFWKRGYFWNVVCVYEGFCGIIFLHWNGMGIPLVFGWNAHSTKMVESPFQWNAHSIEF